MKKNEYVSPEMEIVEIKAEYLMQSGSFGQDGPDKKDPEEEIGPGFPGIGD